MRTFRISLCLAALLAAGPISEATAQQRGSHRSANPNERAARASWQPTRPRTARAIDHPNQLRDADQEEYGSPIRRVGHGAPLDGVPSLPASAIGNRSVSVIEPPIHAPFEGAPIEAAPLDGQIPMPAYDGACDALPGGTCGCGDTVCDGGCDSMGCSPLGCDGACGGENCSCCGELCSPDAWRPCVTICLPQDGWASFEYLSWWQSGMNLPPLVTSNVTAVPQAEAGVLTSPTVRTLFGGNEVLTEQFDGGRLRFGLWLDRCHTWGIGAEYFKIGRESEGFTGTSTGDPILARPFFNTETGVEDSELVAFPGVVSGTVTAEAYSELTGAGVHVRHLRCCDQGCSKWLFCGCEDHYCSRTEALLGWRYLQLDEGVPITEALTATDGSGTFDIIDSFQTRNQFNGVDVGWMYRQTRGYWTFDTLMRLAIGVTHQTVRINGQTISTSDQNNPPTQTGVGGLLALSSNIGDRDRNEFSVVPEFNANIGYQLTDNIRLMFGYTFIYWSNVARPGEHISRFVNPELLPPPVDPITGAQQPEFRWDSTDYWVQGINTGFEFRW